MKYLLILFTICAAFAHNHDDEHNHMHDHHHDNHNHGVGIGEITVNGVKCPVWIVSYNVFLLECTLILENLQFSLDNVPLESSLDDENHILLKLSLTSSIPENRRYTLTASTKNNNRILTTMKPPKTVIPKPVVLNELSRLDYGVKSGNVIVLNTNTLFIPDFYYNGSAPDAFFWVGKGRPSGNGRRIPDQNGKLTKLRRYSGQSITLTLPEDITTDDIDYLSVWCRAFDINFGHVVIPKGLLVPPSCYVPEAMDYTNVKIYPVGTPTGNSAQSGTSLKHNQHKEGNGKDPLIQSSSFLLVLLTFFLNRF